MIVSPSPGSGNSSSRKGGCQRQRGDGKPMDDLLESRDHEMMGSFMQARIVRRSEDILHDAEYHPGPRAEVSGAMNGQRQRCSDNFLARDLKPFS